MSKRMTIAVGAILILANLTFSQEPAALPYNVPPPTPEVLTSTVPSFMDGFDLPHGDGRMWASADYMFNLFHFTRLPALITTSPPGTPRAEAGIIGQQNTSVLFGGNVDDTLRAGFRVGVGYWLNAEHTYSVEAGFMMTESQAALFSASSTGIPILARPFSDARDVNQQAVLIAFPGSSGGSVDARAESGNFFGGHVDLVEKSLDCGWFRLNSMFGYRYFYYSDDLSVNQTIVPTGVTFVPGTKVVSGDEFSTRNVFNGIDMGFRPEFVWGNFTLEVIGKVAFGNLREEIKIAGIQTTTVPGVKPVTQPGGVLALVTNTGTFSNSEWYAMPEAGAALNVQLRPNLKLRVGYSLFVLNGIARAADQINTSINPGFFPGSKNNSGVVTPTFNLTRSDGWLQTLNLGLIYTY